MDTEKKYKRLKLAFAVSIALLVFFSYKYLGAVRMLNIYRDNIEYSFDSYRREIIQQYTNALFPKYKFSTTQPTEDYITGYDFVSRSNPSDMLSFSLSGYAKDTTALIADLSEDTSKYGINLNKLSISRQDIQPQKDIPALEDETTYMLTADIARQQDDKGNELDIDDGENFVLVDEFRRQAYYDEKAANRLGPAGTPDNRFRPDEQSLYIWYGLGITSNSNGEFLYGIDEQSAAGSVSAAQIAAEYLRFMDRNQLALGMYNYSWGASAHNIMEYDGRLTCLLLVGKGQDIKYYMECVDKEGYTVTPLRILDSI